MTVLQIVAVLLISSTYTVLHWSLYRNAKRYSHWTLVDSLDTTFRSRSELRDFWIKMAITLVIADTVLSFWAVSQDWYCLIALFAICFTFKLSLVEILHRP